MIARGSSGGGVVLMAVLVVERLGVAVLADGVVVVVMVVRC